MIRRLLAFTLATALGIGMAHAIDTATSIPGACTDNRDLIDDDPTPTCAALALKAVHKRQLTAFEKARNVLGDADTWHPNRSADDIAAALSVLAETAAMAIRDYRPSMVPSPSDELARTLLWMRQDFQQQGWPEPADIPAGFRFLQARIQAAPASARKAIVTVGLRSARLMPYNEFLLDSMAHELSKEDRKELRKAEAAVRETATQKQLLFRARGCPVHRLASASKARRTGLSISWMECHTSLRCAAWRLIRHGAIKQGVSTAWRDQDVC